MPACATACAAPCNPHGSPIVPPLGRRKIFESTDRPSGSSMTTPSGRRASAPNSSALSIEQAPRAPQFEQFAAGHVARNIGATEPVHFEKAVVAEDHAVLRVGYHHALVEIVEGGADECTAPQLRRLGPAQRRQHPEPDRSQEGDNGDAAEQQLPERNWDRVRRYSSPAQSRRTAARPRPIRTAQRRRPGTRGPAPESNSSRLPASSCQPLPTRGFAARSVWLDGFGSGKRLPMQLQNVTQITAIALT